MYTTLYITSNIIEVRQANKKIEECRNHSDLFSVEIKPNQSNSKIYTDALIQPNINHKYRQKLILACRFDKYIKFDSQS